MFCNINTREIKRNVSKVNIWKNDMPFPPSQFYIPIPRYNFFFLANHFI